MSPVRARTPSRSKSPVRRNMPRSISPVRESRRWSSQSISPGRDTSPRRSRSPNRRRSLHRRRSPVRSKSPIQSRATRRIRSPVSKKATGRPRSPVRGKSPKRSPLRSRSPVRVKSPKKSPLRSRSPLSYSPSPRTKRLKRAQEERNLDRAKDREHGISGVKDYDRGRHKVKETESGRDAFRPRSSLSRSPSPRTKRMKRAQEAKEFYRARDREHDRSRVKDYDKGVHREKERDSNKDVERKGRKRLQSVSPEDDNKRQTQESDSPPRRSADRVPEKSKFSKAGDCDEVVDRSMREMPESDDASNDALAKMKATEEALNAKQNDKNKPSFELSGKLAAETNKVRGITLLFNEPPDARKPSLRWRLYVFKAGEALNEPLYIHRQSCYLFGRERRIADIPTDHPSCSKQHAVVQYRQVEKDEEDGTVTKQVRPYVMDLGSTNGTFLNDNRLEPQRYYELFEKDTIKFGNSSREYVILHENSAG